MHTTPASNKIQILDRCGIHQAYLYPADIDTLMQAGLVTLIGRRRIHAAQLKPGVIMATIYGTLRGSRRLPIAEDSRTVERQTFAGGTVYQHVRTYAWIR